MTVTVAVILGDWRSSITPNMDRSITLTSGSAINAYIWSEKCVGAGNYRLMSISIADCSISIEHCNNARYVQDVDVQVT